MATLSRKTIGTVIRGVECWTRTNIQVFFFENDVPDEIVIGSSKLELVKNVFRRLEQGDEQVKILCLIKEALPKLHPEYQKELRECLLRDGFVFDEESIVDAAPEDEEYKTAVEVLLVQYKSDFGITTLLHHLNECEALFRQEKWDSSISHCRNFVEQILFDIANNWSRSKNDQPDLTRPVKIRDYLEKEGFFDPSEKKKLVEGVYGFFSEEGSHPGISTQSSARISKSILLSFSYYLLEKYDSWKRDDL